MSEIKVLKPGEYSETRVEAMKEVGTWKESTNKIVEKEKIKPITKKSLAVSKTKEVQTTIKESLINNILSLYYKYAERARIQTIMFYWEMGKELNKEYGKPNPRGGNLGKQVRGHLKAASFNDSARAIVAKLKEKGVSIGKTNLNLARKFAEKYPKIKELIKQQDMTWNKIVRKYLPEKKEKEQKSKFNNEVIKNFKRWNGLVNEFYNAIPKIDFSEASDKDRIECVKILNNTIKKIQKRVEELENGKL